MITCTCIGQLGRLGNQMFQIASTIGVAKRNDLAYFFSEWEYQDLFKNELPPVPDEAYALNMVNLSEGVADYRESNLPQGKLYNLFGYFQSFKYFEGQERWILPYLEPKDSVIKYIENEYENHKNKTSIHVRRADYVTLQDYHTLLEMDYYHAAIEIAGKDKEFLIFSDDIEWCKENFKDYNCEYVEERPHDKALTCCPEDYNLLKRKSTKEIDSLNYKKEDVTELILMSMCENNIIANSSFSWWAAYLNKNINKKVIAPRHWFTQTRINQIYRNAEGYIQQKVPESWILVPK